MKNIYGIVNTEYGKYHAKVSQNTEDPGKRCYLHIEQVDCIRGTVTQIILQQIYGRFNTNNNHLIFRIHSCSSW